MNHSKPRYRPTWAEISLSAIEYNFKQVRRIVGRDTKIMVVVKANAYGHGIVEVSKVLERLGVDYLGVATTDEAVRLRERGIKSPILVLGSVLPDEVRALVKNDITLTLCGCDLLDAVKKEAAFGLKAKVHVKVDTGMGRIGIWHEEAIQFIKTIAKEKGIGIEGVYTHFHPGRRCWH